jgi:hypothetical protein
MAIAGIIKQQVMAGLKCGQASIGQLAGLAKRKSEVFGQVMRGNESQKMTAAVVKLAFASLLLAKAGADIGTIKRVFGATDIKEVATGRKERTVNCLATFKPHKKACAERLLSRLIETAGKPAMIDIGTTAASCWFTIADSAFQAATTGDAGVPPEVAALATDKEAFFQQSKAVSTKWWNQSNGKGPGDLGKKQKCLIAETPITKPPSV